MENIDELIKQSFNLTQWQRELLLNILKQQNRHIYFISPPRHGKTLWQKTIEEFIKSEIDI